VGQKVDWQWQIIMISLVAYFYVQCRVAFKLVTLMFKILHGLTPSYLSCQLVPTGLRQLVSRYTNTHVLPWIRFRTQLGDRSFDVADSGTSRTETGGQLY